MFFPTSFSRTTSRYAYLGDGGRISMTVGSETTTYTLDLAAPLVQVLVAHESVGQRANKYLYGIVRIGEYDDNWHYYLTDHLGSVRSLVGAEGDVEGIRMYQPFGLPLNVAGNINTMYGFTGEQTDATGLIYLRARYYGPSLRQFTQSDMWGGDVKSPLTTNPFLYVMANPIGMVDPSGQVGCPPLPPGECEPPDDGGEDGFAAQAEITQEEIDAHGGLGEYYRTESEQWVLARTMYGETKRYLSNRFIEMRYMGLVIKIRVESNYNDWNENSGEGGTGPTSWHNQILRNKLQFAALWDENTRASNPDDLFMFQVALVIAQNVINAPISVVPEELRGYDGWRASEAGIGETYREGGKKSKQFHAGQNVYRDDTIVDEGLRDDIDKCREEPPF